MGEETKLEQFHFLSDWEFSELASKDKVAYLSRASQELEQRQRMLKGQMQTLRPGLDRPKEQAERTLAT